MGAKIGIDLGTTYSAIAVMDDTLGKPIVVKNSYGSSTTPSSVCFLSGGNILFGDEAKSEYIAGNPNAMAFYKRHMGDESYYRVIDGKNYSATDLSAVFLKLLVADIEDQLKDKVDGAVISVPAYFAHKQVEATIAAAKQAGLKLLSTIHEPTAAAFAYGLNKSEVSQTILFYDLGGGTFDVTIAKVSGAGIDVLGSDGDHSLGGKDWDDSISRYLATQLAEKYDVDILSLPEKMVIIQGRAEQVKKQLTVKATVAVPISLDGKKYELEISRVDFSEVSEALCERTSDIIANLFGDLNITWHDIDRIILVGGSTKMPMIREYIERLTDTKIEVGVNVDEAVAIGAAIKASLDESGRLIIGAGSNSPSNSSPNPTLLRIGFKVSDVVAHSLGMIATDANGEEYVNSLIIKKNSKIPVSETKPHKFFASKRNTEMEVFALQGEELKPLDNTVINKYVITGIDETNKKKGEQIDVTYSYDSDGLIVVTASQNGKPLDIRIESVPEDMSWANKPPVLTSPVTILLAVDLSGSMSGTPLDKAKHAMLGFVDDLSESGSDIGVLLFADSEHFLHEPSKDYRSLKTKINGIVIGQNGVGYGNMTDPFKKAGILNGGDYLVVLTDGVWSNQSGAIQRAQTLKEQEVNIIALGFGGADAAFLKKIASVDDFASITDLSKLGDSFSKIAQVIQTGSGSIS